LTIGLSSIIFDLRSDVVAVGFNPL